MTVRVAVVGASGRMGKAIMGCLLDDPECVLSGAVVRAGSGAEGRDAGELAGRETAGLLASHDLAAAVDQSDAVIDFSTVATTEQVVTACASAGKALLIGTTGLDASTQQRLDVAASDIPVLLAANTSVGVTVLRHLAAQAAALLGPEYDLEVVEMHHRHKVDAPSGTAVVLAEDLAKARGLSAKDAVVHGRSGRIGARTREEIGVMTLRGGEVIGDHTVHLAGPAERLELTHRAQDRSLFARGAVRAVKWLADRERRAGRYQMADVLGLSRQ